MKKWEHCLSSFPYIQQTVNVLSKMSKKYVTPISFDTLMFMFWEFLMKVNILQMKSEHGQFGTSSGQAEMSIN